VEIDARCCETLKLNRPQWNVVQADVREWSVPKRLRGQVDLLAGGLPCPPFSVAGKQLGKNDERDMFPAAIRIISEARPRAIMIENVPGLLEKTFDSYREHIENQLHDLGYRLYWERLNACDFGVPQLRRRVALVGIRRTVLNHFVSPRRGGRNTPTVGQAIADLIAERGWKGASAWGKKANEIAPTIVGGSTKHGGPDLGPSRARTAWAALGVDGRLIAEHAPDRDFDGMPHLTVRMVARIQGFPDGWIFSGKKTAQYRQVGNAFPPPVAKAVANRIAKCIHLPGVSHAAAG
jgi:DNA (cytosine-5)-methyltransferase 1